VIIVVSSREQIGFWVVDDSHSGAVNNSSHRNAANKLKFNNCVILNAGIFFADDGIANDKH